MHGKANSEINLINQSNGEVSLSWHIRS